MNPYRSFKVTNFEFDQPTKIQAIIPKQIKIIVFTVIIVFFQIYYYCVISIKLSIYWNYQKN